MRRVKASAEEIIKAEKAKDDRQRSRSNGYSMMHQRDVGISWFSNGVGFRWKTVRDNDELEEGEFRMAPPPEGKFVLVVRGESILFDAEEFRRQLRWV